MIRRWGEHARELALLEASGPWRGGLQWAAGMRPCTLGRRGPAGRRYRPFPHRHPGAASRPPSAWGQVASESPADPAVHAHPPPGAAGRALPKAPRGLACVCRRRALTVRRSLCSTRQACCASAVPGTINNSRSLLRAQVWPIFYTATLFITQSWVMQSIPKVTTNT